MWSEIHRVLVISVPALVGREMKTALVNPNILQSYVDTLDKGFENLTGTLVTEIYGSKNSIRRYEFISEMLLRPYLLVATEYRQKLFSSYNSLPRSISSTL